MKLKFRISPILAAGLFFGVSPDVFQNSSRATEGRVPEFRSAVEDLRDIRASSSLLSSPTRGHDGELAICAIESGEQADLIGINGGLKQGLIRGMVLTVFRGGQRVGELLLTRVEEQCAVALIANLETKKTLAIGDKVTPKLRNLLPL